MRSRLLLLLALGLPAALLTGCDGLFGAKDDATTDEIFEEGAIDPTLLDEVGYVPLAPFYTEGVGGALQGPTDVYAGYDDLLYVADARGLHVLDLAGRPQFFLGEIGWDGAAAQPLGEVEALVQDRRLDLYVAARRDTTLGDRTWNLPVIYRIGGLTTGQPVLRDIIWHPFDDQSRTSNQFRNPRTFSGGGSDEDARFTDVAVLPDNRIYVTRAGGVNTQADGLPSIVRPFNGVLLFTAAGVNTGFVSALSPTSPSLLSAVYPTAIQTYVGPPQRASFPNNSDFVLAQAPPGGGLRYGVLSVRVVETPNGTEYRVDTEKLGAAANPEAGDGFLYGDFRFEAPSALAYAADATGYLFVLDAGKDSLFVFNRNGVEGVAPPPGAGTLRPVRVSFGGTGGGPLQFRSPQGVAYLNRIVYVADTGNDRIARFRLNTDFE